MIRVSRLLKSWATRPATWPMASSRWACTRARSARRTSLTSTPATRTVGLSIGEDQGRHRGAGERQVPEVDGDRSG